jgi:hypothetical protein
MNCDPITKTVALEMLRDGLITQSEAARMADVSRQLMRLWAADIDWRKARRGWVLTQWNQRARDVQPSAVSSEPRHP